MRRRLHPRLLSKFIFKSCLWYSTWNHPECCLQCTYSGPEVVGPRAGEPTTRSGTWRWTWGRGNQGKSVEFILFHLWWFNDYIAEWPERGRSRRWSEVRRVEWLLITLRMKCYLKTILLIDDLSFGLIPWAWVWILLRFSKYSCIADVIEWTKGK